LQGRILHAQDLMSQQAKSRHTVMCNRLKRREEVTGAYMQAWASYHRL
jgi:hypothetical protein